MVSIVESTKKRVKQTLSDHWRRGVEKALTWERKTRNWVIKIGPLLGSKRKRDDSEGK